MILDRFRIIYFDIYFILFFQYTRVINRTNCILSFLLQWVHEKSDQIDLTSGNYKIL